MHALARHPGKGSGCQGCDPDVALPDVTAQVFLCALCVTWLELHGVQDVPEDERIALLARRREALHRPEPDVFD